VLLVVLGLAVAPHDPQGTTTCGTAIATAAVRSSSTPSGLTPGGPQPTQVTGRPVADGTRGHLAVGLLLLGIVVVVVITWLVLRRRLVAHIHVGGHFHRASAHHA
jgi:hypothetical protein